MGIIASIALATMVAGTITSTVGSLKANKAAQGAAKLQAGQAKVEAQRERIKQIRASRAARAQIEQAGANAGAESSSAITGAGSVTSQGFGNIQAINSQEAVGQAVGRQYQKQMNAQGVATLGSGVASLGGTIFAGSAEISDIFGIPKPDTTDYTYGVK